MGLDSAKLAKQSVWSKVIFALAIVTIALTPMVEKDHRSAMAALTFALIILAIFVRYWGQSCFPFC